MQRFKSFYLNEASFDMSKVGMCKRLYTGDIKETGKTSIVGKVTVGIKDLSQTFNTGSKIIDFGSGRMPPRNADYLRNLGFDVYAYDPFNGKPSVDGWEMGKVSSKIPKGMLFDEGFTSYVLNVVKLKDENFIVNTLKKLVKGKSYHLVRDDLYPLVYKGLVGKKNKHMIDFFKNEYTDKETLERFEMGILTEEDLLCFARFGFMTGKGKFQRLVVPSDNVLNTEKQKRNNWVLYSKV